MEKAKPSKKKAYYKNRKPDASGEVSNKYIDWRQVGKKTVQHEENSSDTSPDEKNHKEQKNQYVNEKENFSKRPLTQPKTRLGDLDKIWQETNVGEDFETLIHAPVSSSHFVFKSEKNWTLDASKYDEFFLIDMKNLADIVNCIPFNRLIDLDDKYFNKDELTNINNTAEQAKIAYNEKLKTLRKESSGTDSGASRSSASDDDNMCCCINRSPESTRLPDSEITPDSKTTEEDLDFLLSLKEPVRAQPIAVNLNPPKKNNSDELKTKNIPAATKSIDLEKWLDLVLDD